MSRVEIGALDGEDQRQESSQDAIFIGTRDRIESSCEPLEQALAVGAGAPLGVEALGKQRVQIGGDDRVCRERSLHVTLTEGHATLQQISAAGAQDVDVVGRQLRLQYQSVETVIFELAVTHEAQRSEQSVAIFGDVECGPRPQFERKVLQRHFVAPGERFEHPRTLGEHA